MTHAPQHYVRFFIPVVRHSAFPASWQAGARGTGRRVQPMPGLQVSSRCFQVRTSPCTRALEAAEAPPTGGPWTAPRPAGPSCSSCNLQPLPARTEQVGTRRLAAPGRGRTPLAPGPPAGPATLFLGPHCCLQASAGASPCLLAPSLAQARTSLGSGGSSSPSRSLSSAGLLGLGPSASLARLFPAC